MNQYLLLEFITVYQSIIRIPTVMNFNIGIMGVNGLLQIYGQFYF